MIKIPQKLKVGGFTYRITKNKQVAVHSDTFGSTSLTFQNINISPEYPIEKQEQTFFHEILHAIWFTYGLKEAGYYKKTEENVIDALSNGLYQVFKDNKLIS